MATNQGKLKGDLGKYRYKARIEFSDLSYSGAFLSFAAYIVDYAGDGVYQWILTGVPELTRILNDKEDINI